MPLNKPQTYCSGFVSLCYYFLIYPKNLLGSFMPFSLTGIVLCGFAVDVSLDCCKNKNLIQDSFVQIFWKLFLSYFYCFPFFLYFYNADGEGTSARVAGHGESFRGGGLDPFIHSHTSVEAMSHADVPGTTVGTKAPENKSIVPSFKDPRE